MSLPFEEDVRPVYQTTQQILDDRLETAREVLRKGGSLKHAAAEIGWFSDDLDKALWARLGR